MFIVVHIHDDEENDNVLGEPSVTMASKKLLLSVQLVLILNFFCSGT